MAIVASRPTVGTAPTLIAQNATPNDGPVSGEAQRFSIIAKNMTGTASVFLGGADVTTLTGYEWTTADRPLSLDLEPGEKLYGVVVIAEQTVHVLRRGR